MLIAHRHNSKYSRFILYALAFIFSFFVCLSWVNAKEPPKPKPEKWQINGIVAALDDGHDKVKEQALMKFKDYDWRNLSSIIEKPENLAKKLAEILKDKSKENFVRAGAATTLGNLGELAQPYVSDIANILKDKSADSLMRQRAAEGLGKLGELAKPYISDIANILQDKSADSSLRYSAVLALGNLGELAEPYAEYIDSLLKDKSVDLLIRAGAAEALGNFGNAAKPYIKDIVAFLKDKSLRRYVHISAVTGLANLGELGQPYLPDILEFLKDQSIDSDVRGSAVDGLAKMGKAAQPYIKYMIEMTKDQSVDETVRYNLLLALRDQADLAQPYVKDIVDIVNNKSLESIVRHSALQLLGKLGEVAQPYAQDLANIAKDKSLEIFLRSQAAITLGRLGKAAQPYIPELAELLKNKSLDSYLRYGAAMGLVNQGEAAKGYTQDIFELLKDKSLGINYRSRILEELSKQEPLNLNYQAIALDSIYYVGELDFPEQRFFAYFVSGGSDEAKTLLKWIGFPHPKTIPPSLSREEGIKTLKIFAQAWESSRGLERLQPELAKQITMVARKVIWQPQDILLLQSHYNNLKKFGFPEADSLQAIIVNLQGWQWIYKARTTILTHVTFWLTLIFAYPKFPQIQAIFFWNIWVRRILGMGYVGFLITWIPFLRHKIFEPFQPSLLADAGLDNFNDKGYFPESKVKIPSSGEILPVTQALPKIQGQIILQGDSGLGKSMFIRHLLKNSHRIVVYLPAQKCHKGVIEAIQDKLHGQAQDADFLKNLIYSGAIDICIDGLNEVTAETRAKIVQFVESYFRGNIIMTTQPLEWTPPATAKTYYLQPLEQNQIQEFLLSRQSRLPQDAKLQGADYAKACTNYLQEVLSPQQSKEELEAARRILSNPMDLTVVALMLSQGQHPDLFRLQQQQYNLMAEEYLTEWNQEFPLKKFSAAVYEMRVQDKQALPAEEFYQVVMSLEDEKYKMVVSRQWQDGKGEAKKEWYFRHDKIMDFFLVQNFLGNSDEAEALLVERMGDSRFRGVYFLLATLLPLDAAKELREKLIQYAADTKDNTVSNTFVQLLRAR